jgi:ligand-binding sensor domain-containing protein
MMICFLKLRNASRVSGKKLLTVLFFALSITPALAQRLKFDHLSVKQGLSQGNVWDIHQDKYGFIWVGTEDGLNLYDGYGFTIFRNNPADSFSISNNNIDCFAEDRYGNLWIGTQNGLNFYNRELNRFERFYHETDMPGSLSNSDIGHIYFDSKNRFWVGTVVGLNLYDSTSKTFTPFYHEPSDPKSIADNTIENIFEDSMHRLWIATGGGLSMLNADGKSFTNYRHDPADPQSISTNKTMFVFEDKDHTLWIGTFDGGLNKFDPSTKKFTRYQNIPNNPQSLGNNYVYCVAENKEGQLWVATDGYLNLMDKSQGTFTRYTNVQGDDEGLNSGIIAEIFFDRNNRMWIGTRFGGINVYDKEKYGFQHFKYNSFEANSLNNNNVTDFAEEQAGNFWIGTDGGSLNYYDRKTGKFTSHMNIFTNNKVLAVAQDERGGIWVGMWAGGVNYFDPRTKKVKKYLFNANDPNSLSDNNVFDILIDNAGAVWIGTWGNGLNRYNPETDDFTRFVHDPNNENSISTSPISILMQDSFGKIWIGTEQQGLDMFDPTTNTFTHYKAGAEKGELSGSSVFSLCEDSKKRLWVGTNGSGLNLLDRQTKKFTTYRQRDGLPNDGIMGILEDKNGNLWISTNKGVSRFDPEKKTFKNYTESDGLQSDQFNRWAYAKLSTGELLFGGTNGFNIFNPENIRENDFIPPVYITDFKLFNKSVPVGENEVLKKNILLTDEITLDYFQNIISFDFTALNYRQPEKNRYKYMMEGFQDDWTDAGSERKASYTNLSPGDYTFRVIASNNDNVWNETGASLKITIVPPFWKTWWFNSALALAIVSAIVGYIRYHRKKAKRQQAELKAIIDERTQELSRQNEEIIRKSEQERVYNWITQGLAQVSETISKNNNNLNALTNEALKTIVKYVNAQQGILAIANKDNEDDEHLQVFATYGISKKHLKSERIEVGAGMLGEAYKDKQKRTFDQLPEGYIKIESGLGEAPPAQIVLLPLKTEDGDVVGVVELAFLESVTDMIQQFLDKVSSLVALNIFAATLTHKTMLLLQQSKEQTEEMRAQEEEMRQNMEELEATTEEFRRRELEYQRKISELQSKLK